MSYMQPCAHVDASASQVGFRSQIVRTANHGMHFDVCSINGSRVNGTLMWIRYIDHHWSLNYHIFLICLILSWTQFCWNSAVQRRIASTSEELLKAIAKANKNETMQNALSFNALNMHFSQKLSDEHFRRCRMLQLSPIGIIATACQAATPDELLRSIAPTREQELGDPSEMWLLLNLVDSASRLLQHDPNLVFWGGFDCLMSNFVKCCVNYLSTGVM